MGRGSEQAAVGSPLGDCRSSQSCPTQRVSIHQHPHVTAEAAPGASAPLYLQARARGSRDKQAKFPQQEAAGEQGN